jgi:hypothetical protein
MLNSVLSAMDVSVFSRRGSARFPMPRMCILVGVVLEALQMTIV